MPLNVGVFGNGYWSQIIQQKFQNFNPEEINLAFVADSKSDYISRLGQFNLDWAIVASYNSTHYEIVESCLREGISVFCEKPLVSHPEEAESLYALAKKNKCSLYVDDVFVWRTDIKDYLAAGAMKGQSVKAFWFKPDKINNPRRCLNDLLYHHLYLIAEALNFSRKISVKASIKGERLYVTITDSSKEHRSFRLKYGLSGNKARHMFDNLDLALMSNDALKEMLLAVFEQKADLDRAERRTKWATKVLYEIKKQVMPSVGVIGGGVFGCTAAILLADEGCDVTVYEKANDIILGATAKNQLRVHRGYHYPRSKETALSSRQSEVAFKSYYREAVEDGNRHFYAIAKSGSMTSPAQFEEFMGELDLPYTKSRKGDPIYGLFRDEAISAIYEVEESLYSPDKLRSLIKSRFLVKGVKTRTGHEVDLSNVKNKHRFIISATYSSPLTFDQEYQFEVCEKPLVKLPEEFKKISILIFDGPFMGIDPVPSTPYYVLDSVKDAIYHTNIGPRPEIPPRLEAYISGGLIKNPEKSHYNLFLKTGQKFYKKFEPVEYMGSYFVVRAVLPYREHDDARPSLITKIGNNCYDIFSGKVTTAPRIGQQLVHDLLYEDGGQYRYRVSDVSNYRLFARRLGQFAGSIRRNHLS